MITTALHGRLGADPVERQTKNGKAMVTATVAVDAARHGADADTAWFNLVAFGRAAKDLMRHQKGDLVACMGGAPLPKTATPPTTARNGKAGPSTSSPSYPPAP